MFEKWKETWQKTAGKIEIETYTLYLAYKDPKVPSCYKIFIILVIGYILSPIDPIPDFIPVIGYLDEFLLITVGIPFLLKMIPEEIMEEHREKAETKFSEGMPKTRIVAVIIILIWILLAIIILNFILKLI